MKSVEGTVIDAIGVDTDRIDVAVQFVGRTGRVVAEVGFPSFSEESARLLVMERAPHAVTSAAVSR